MSVKAWAACWLLISVVTRVPPARPQAIDSPHESPPRNARVAPSRVGNGQCEPWIRENYTSIQVNVDGHGCNLIGDAANEPSIAISAIDPRKIVIGWRQFNSVESDFREAGYAYSHDGGHTWMFTGCLTPGEMGTDPVLASGAAGEVYYLSINFDEMRFFTSTDAGLTWTKQIVKELFIDKPWMTVNAGGNIATGKVYIHGGNRIWRSSDGVSFEEFVSLSHLGSFVTMSIDLSGTLFLAESTSMSEKYPNIGDMSMEPTAIALGPAIPGYIAGRGLLPNPGGLFGQGWIVADRSNDLTQGNVYYLASVVPGSDLNIDVRFARSVNGGKTWDPSVRVNDDPPENEAYHWFGMMSVAPNGRIDAVWNDTRNGGGAPNLCELFYSYSLDAGNTWSPNVPVSPMFDSWVGWPGGQRKLGDYYHMVSDNLGVNVAYAATFNGEQDIYFLRIGPWDCNGNEVDDAADISSGASKDCNANDVPDECEYRVDIDGDGLTTLDDYTLFQAALAGPPAPLLDEEEIGGGLPRADASGLPDDPPESPLGKGGGQAPLLDKEGAGGGPLDCFELFDADHNGQIDLADYAYLQRVFVSP